MQDQTIRALLLVLTFSSIGMLRAQDGDKVRTLFGSDDRVAHGGWGAPAASYTRILDQDALLVGGRGGWLIDHHLTIGIAGQGLVSSVTNPAYDVVLEETGSSGSSRLRLGYGGLLIQPHIAPKSPVHVSLPVIFGGGACGYRYSGTWFAPLGINQNGTSASTFLLVEPGLSLELNMIPLVRFAMSASYRYTSEIDLTAARSDVLNGWNFGFSFMVGRF